MKVKLILPALTEATSPYWRPIKYSLFPPLGLATLAAYLPGDDEITIEDEHVEPLRLSDEPDLVAIQVYITNAYRAYEIADHYRARGAHVCVGGPHVTSLPDEALDHADTVFLGPGEDTWPTFLTDHRAGRPRSVYRSTERDLVGHPRPRRDLIKRHLYLVPNSMVVSRGCPHRCDFCYSGQFYAGGAPYYHRRVDEALAEIESLPGRHLYFLDDNLWGDPRFAEALFDGMKGMNRVWQAAGSIEGVMRPGMLERAADAGLRSLFVGFETLSDRNLAAQSKVQNLGGDYEAAIRRLHDLGVMINGSFIFGLDEDDESVFGRTVEWAVGQGTETATFHILTPYPGTRLHARLSSEGRILTTDWSRYDTRHAVFTPAGMSPEALESGYRRAYDAFYTWKSIAEAAWTKDTLAERLRHLAFTAAWRKMDWLWHLIISAKRVSRSRGLLEALLDSGCRRSHRPLPDTSAGAGDATPVVSR